MKNISVAVLLLGLGLVACRGDQTPAPLASISGTVVERDPSDGGVAGSKTIAWTGGAGSVSGTVGAGMTVVATGGTLASNGAFSLNLPATISNDLLTAPSVGFKDYRKEINCTGTPTISDPNLKVASLNLKVDASNKSGSIAPMSASGVSMNNYTMKTGALLYADRAAKISGDINCSGTVNGMAITIKRTINYSLTAGWNKVAFELATVTDAGKMTSNDTLITTNGSLPTDNWVLGY